MLQCFNKELHRPSAGHCRSTLIDLWEQQLHSPWTDHEGKLHPRRRSPCVTEWDHFDRVEHFQLVRLQTTNLLIKRYETAPLRVRTNPHIVKFLKKLKDRHLQILQESVECSNERRQKKCRQDVVIKRSESEVRLLYS